MKVTISKLNTEFGGFETIWEGEMQAVPRIDDHISLELEGNSYTVKSCRWVVPDIVYLTV